jgi:hypothetical protein
MGLDTHIFIYASSIMTARDFFRAGSRLLGVYSLWTGLGYFATAFNVLREFSRPGSVSATGYLVHAVVDMLVGAYLLFSSHLTDILYPETRKNGEDLDRVEEEL